MSAPDSPDPASQARPWWKKPSRAAAAVVLVAMIGVGGYLGINALGSHTSSPTTQRTLPQVEGLPSGATHCDPVYKDLLVPFNASARGTPMTSCPFAEQVRREYSRHSATQPGAVPLKVVSPTTELQYDVTCFATGGYATCSGGAAAVIYLYNQPAR